MVCAIVFKDLICRQIRNCRSQKGLDLKKFIVFIALSILSISLAGCGSSSPAATASDTSATTTATVSTTGTPAVPPAPVKLSVPRKFETDKNTPTFFIEALKKKQPILIVFYNDDDPISKEVLPEVKTVYDKYNGSVIFLQLKSDLNEQVSNLAEQFHIGFIPYMAVINRDGTIIFEKTGYVDSKVIEQAVYDAVNK